MKIISVIEGLIEKIVERDEEMIWLGVTKEKIRNSGKAELRIDDSFARITLWENGEKYTVLGEVLSKEENKIVVKFSRHFCGNTVGYVATII